MQQALEILWNRQVMENRPPSTFDCGRGRRAHNKQIKKNPRRNRKHHQQQQQQQQHRRRNETTDVCSEKGIGVLIDRTGSALNKDDPAAPSSIRGRPQWINLHTNRVRSSSVSIPTLSRVHRDVRCCCCCCCCCCCFRPYSTLFFELFLQGAHVTRGAFESLPITGRDIDKRRGRRARLDQENKKRQRNPWESFEP